jgi:hypothetical protein
MSHVSGLAHMSHPIAAMKRAFQWLGLFGAATLVVGLAAGCSQSPDTGTTDDELHSAQRTKDNLLTDEELLGTAGSNTVVPDAAQIQKFLEKTPHNGVRSILADKKVTLDDGTESPPEYLVSEMIYDAAKQGGINPLELLVRLQLEQGLVGKRAGDLSADELDKKLKYAMGCGCPHAPICARDPDSYTGFYQQVSCAVRILKGHMDDAKTKGHTSTGWGIDITKTTEDEAEITPENNATAVLYTYTPYAGEDFDGQPSSACKNAKGQPDYCSGAALHTWLWDSYATAIRGTKTTGAATDAGAPSTHPPVADAGEDPPYVDEEEDAGEDVPPAYGECSSDADCASSTNGGACFSDDTCGCFSDSDCTTAQRCDTATNHCKTRSTPPPTPPPSSGSDAGGLPRPNGPSGGSGFPLYDAGYGNTDQSAATPPATAPRPADDPAARPTPGASVGDIGYSTNNPYGDGTSTADSGKKKKKKPNAAIDSGGCSIASPGTSGTHDDLPSAFFLVAGVAAIVGGRKRKKERA